MTIFEAKLITFIGIMAIGSIFLAFKSIREDIVDMRYDISFAKTRIANLELQNNVQKSRIERLERERGKK